MKTRPGYKILFRCPDGKAGGLTSLLREDGSIALIFIVDDVSYISEYPFEKYEELKPNG